MTTIAHPVLGPYTQVQDLARLHYGRLLWQCPQMRDRLLHHWQDARHPYARRFSAHFRPLVERVLSSAETDDASLDEALQLEGQSLRSVVREIPPVMGSFFAH